MDQNIIVSLAGTLLGAMIAGSVAILTQWMADRRERRLRLIEREARNLEELLEGSATFMRAITVAVEEKYRNYERGGHNVPEDVKRSFFDAIYRFAIQGHFPHDASIREKAKQVYERSTMAWYSGSPGEAEANLKHLHREMDCLQNSIAESLRTLWE